MNNNCKLLRLALASVWLLSAIASIYSPQAQNMALLERTGLSGAAAHSALYAGRALDAAMGLLTLVNLRALQKWYGLLRAS